MNNTQITLVFIISTLLLAACTHTPTTQVDDISLLRSMVYTQRHLIELELNPPQYQTPNQHHRHNVLLQSYCDLIDRDQIKTEVVPQPCRTPTAPNDKESIQYCMANFHRCISRCVTPKHQCTYCENQAQQCLASGNALQKSTTNDFP